MLTSPPGAAKASAGDVEHAGGAQTVFGRQRAGQKRHAADEVGVEERPETGYALGDDDAVDPGLDVGVFVADVEIGIGDRRIVGHARQLQDDLVDRRVVDLRQFLDGVAADGVSRSADFRQEIHVARLIELLHLGVQDCLRGRGRIRRRRRLWPGDGSGLRFCLRRADDDLRQLRLAGARGGGKLLAGWRGRLRYLLLLRSLLILQGRWLLRLRVSFKNARHADSDSKRSDRRIAAEYPPLLLFV